MRTKWSLLTIALGLATTAGASAKEQRADPLPLSECLRTERIDIWHVDREQGLLIKSGRHHFRIEFEHLCPTLGDGGFLGISGAQTSADFLCGRMGERVATRLGYCRVDRVIALSKEDYREQVRQLPHGHAPIDDLRSYPPSATRYSRSSE